MGESFLFSDWKNVLVSACHDLAARMSPLSKDFYQWMYRAAIGGHPKAKRVLCKCVLEIYSEYPKLPHVFGPAVFVLGTLLCRQDRPVELTSSVNLIKASNWIGEMYQEFCADVKSQIKTWMLVAFRLRRQGAVALCRDIILLIASMIWKARSEALFVPAAGIKRGAARWRGSSAMHWNMAVKAILGKDSGLPKEKGVVLFYQSFFRSSKRLSWIGNCV